MPLEATMLIIDNSEYMRNGDYQPTRFEAQSDAVNVIFQTKIDSNPENTVGIMTMAGKGPEVLVTHTKDLGQVLGGIHTASGKIGGEIDIPTALAVAQLALKHRENKNLRQRIIVFVGSPPGDGPDKDEQAMIKLAKKLKKNNVAVDIVSFGDGIEEEVDGPKVLKSFIDNINSSDNSHLLTVPPGAHLLSDALISSPILSVDRSSSIPAEFGGTGASSAAAGPSSSNDFEFGVDPSLDPELAMALRMSMQEAQAREAAEAATTPSSAPSTTAAPTVPATSIPAAIPTTTVPADPTDDEEERMLQEALALSQQSQGSEEDDDEDDEEDGDVEMGEDEDGDEDDEDEDEDEDEAIAKAIAMSMETHEDEKKKSGKQ